MKSPNPVTMAEHFGWKLHPFSDTYRLDEPFITQQDQRVTNQAQMLLQQGKSLALTGPSGSGKSKLIEHLLSHLDVNYYQPVLIHYGGLNRTGLLKAVADKFGVEITGRSVPLLVKLQKHIASVTSGSHAVHPVIVVDDAQQLERQSLMDLCSLIVCPPKKMAAASLIIVGDETLAKQLTLTVMKPIRTRLTINFRVESLTDQQVEQFIAFRVEFAKAPKDLFEPDTPALVAAYCHGNRRQIMNICTVLLAEAFYRKEKTISSQLFTECDLLN